MNDEQFTHIAADLKTLLVGQKTLESAVEELRAGQLMLLSRVGSVEDGQHVVSQRMSTLEQRMTWLEQRVGVLHEDVLDRIKAIADPTVMLRNEIATRDDAVREELTRRLDPLELTVRSHSAQLTRLKKRRR